ncbi:MAG: hypothetical protein PHU68_08745 [Paludibacter sp.]|nr:hypothetical protein [Paludibacter sp.]
MKTKHILLFLVLYLNVNTLLAQDIIKRQTFAINLEAYEDTWEYNEGGEIFRIYLKIVPKDTKFSYGLCLIGDYFYSKNNVILDTYTASDVPEVYNDINSSKIIIYASNGKYESISYANPNELNMFFYDKQRKKEVYSGKIQLLSSNQIRWILEDDEGDYDAEDWVEPGFSVPTNIILTRKSLTFVK